MRTYEHGKRRWEHASTHRYTSMNIHNKTHTAEDKPVKGASSHKKKSKRANTNCESSDSDAAFDKLQKPPKAQRTRFSSRTTEIN